MAMDKAKGVITVVVHEGKADLSARAHLLYWDSQSNESLEQLKGSLRAERVEHNQGINCFIDLSIAHHEAITQGILEAIGWGHPCQRRSICY